MKKKKRKKLRPSQYFSTIHSNGSLNIVILNKKMNNSLLYLTLVWSYKNNLQMFIYGYIWLYYMILTVASLRIDTAQMGTFIITCTYVLHNYVLRKSVTTTRVYIWRMQKVNEWFWHSRSITDNYYICTVVISSYLNIFVHLRNSRHGLGN